MRIKRCGKCETCGMPTTEIKEFIEPVDMFKLTPAGTIEGQLAIDIKKWRKKPMLCDSHKEDSYVPK